MCATPIRRWTSPVKFMPSTQLFSSVSCKCKHSTLRIPPLGIMMTVSIVVCMALRYLGSVHLQHAPVCWIVLGRPTRSSPLQWVLRWLVWWWWCSLRIWSGGFGVGDRVHMKLCLRVTFIRLIIIHIPNVQCRNFIAYLYKFSFVCVHLHVILKRYSSYWYCLKLVKKVLWSIYLHREWEAMILFGCLVCSFGLVYAPRPCNMCAGFWSNLRSSTCTHQHQ